MIRQTALGTFSWDDQCWCSEPISVPLFGGAAVQVQLFCELEASEILQPDEADALRRFLALPQEHGLDVVPHLWRYYLDMWESAGPPAIPSITGPSTIWRHVTPRYVSVDHDEDGVPYVVVEALCDWEIEHGLQLVLQRGQRWVRVSDYSGHLTDGRAWDRDSLDDWMADPSKTLPVRSAADISAMLDKRPVAGQKRGTRLKWLTNILCRRR